jgi:hypothetical protein
MRNELFKKYGKKSYFDTKGLFRGNLPSPAPLVNNKITEEKLKLIQYKIRGFGKRHWRQLSEFMKKENYEKTFFNHIKLSFCKFKVMKVIDPMNKNNILWIYKNFLTLEGQKLYSEFFDSMLEVGYDMSASYVNRMGGYPDKVWRLLSYFKNTSPTDWLPLRCFPSIIFEKRRMDLAFLPLEENYDLKEVRETFFNYIYELKVDKLFIPPPDILYKVGNQLYNDSGVVRKDYERPSQSVRCGFKYQYFLAQPLSPREIWLPDKFTKNNNLFFMTVCRQLLKQEDAYPSPNVEETWEKVKGKLLNVIRFDISGFGFQYPRVFLKLMTSVIEELYPCSELSEQANDLYSILDSVKVEHGMEIVFPPRGIGLGYYEDLKTLCMLALVKEFDPLSIYGDQGLFGGLSAYSAIPKLVQHDFVIKMDKVEFSSHLDGMVKWAGHSFTNNELIKVKTLSNAFIGSFFGETHWERKLNLISFYNENKTTYKFWLKRIYKLYNLIFGYEFFEGDVRGHFLEGGLNPNASLSSGETKVHLISEKMRPYSDNFFEAPYVTPFKKRSKKSYPRGVNKHFQEERQLGYLRVKPIDTFVRTYFNPRLEYNSEYKPSSRLIPDWADYLYLTNHGVSTGNFTFGLDTTKLSIIAQNYTFGQDPLRAAARGGYKILDIAHSSYYPLGREWSLVIEFLETLQKRDLTYVNRCDLPQTLFLSEDPLYYNSDLYSFLIQKSQSLKRPRSVLSTEYVPDDRVLKLLRENTSELLGRGIIDTLTSAVSVADFALETITPMEDVIDDYENFENNFIDDYSSFIENEEDISNYF